MGASSDDQTTAILLFPERGSIGYKTLEKSVSIKLDKMELSSFLCKF